VSSRTAGAGARVALTVYTLCTTKTMEGVYYQAEKMNTAEESEKLLKSYGLRKIEVCRVFAELDIYSYQVMLV